MDDNERGALAKARAEGYAPAPTGGSLMAGLCGGVVALGAIVAASRFYSFQIEDHLVAAAAVTTAGFVGVFIAYKRASRRNRKARRHERSKIDEHCDGAASQSSLDSD